MLYHIIVCVSINHININQGRGRYSAATLVCLLISSLPSKFLWKLYPMPWKIYTSLLSQIQVLEEMEELRYLQWLLYVQVLSWLNSWTSDSFHAYMHCKSHHIIDSCLCHQIICAEVSMHHPQDMQGLQYGIASCICYSERGVEILMPGKRTFGMTDRPNIIYWSKLFPHCGSRED